LAGSPLLAWFQICDIMNTSWLLFEEQNVSIVRFIDAIHMADLRSRQIPSSHRSEDQVLRYLSPRQVGKRQDPLQTVVIHVRKSGHQWLLLLPFKALKEDLIRLTKFFAFGLYLESSTALP
jgi:hypothetical protein